MRLWPFALAALALCAVGCQPGRFSETTSQAQAGVFRYPIVTNPTTMDPHLVQDGDTIDLLQHMYEGLVGWGTNNEPVGLLAETWTTSPDGKVWTFTLRSGAKFHNGRPVTAEDVKWSFERATDPKLASPVADAYLSDIVGVTEKVNGKAAEIAGVKATGPLTVEITLKAPAPYFLGKLTYIVSAVLPKESVPADGPIIETGQMVGTGPFKLESFKPQQLVVLAANKDYYLGAPKVEKIERLVVGDAVTRLAKFKNGEVDLVMLERQDIAGIEKDAALKPQLKLFPRPALWYVGLNQVAISQFRDVRVRQAFAHAIDKRRIVDELLGGVNTVANSIVPPGIPGGARTDAKAIPFDPARGKALLAEAGFPNGLGFPSLTITFREDRPDIKTVAEAVASDLKTHLNVDVKLQTMEWGAYLQKYNRKEQAFFHMRWAADYLDPQNFLSHMLATNGPENKIGYSNPEFDRLTSEADRLLSMEERLPLYAQAEDIALQDAVWIPVYFQRDAELISPRVQGLRESLFGHLPHTSVSVAAK